MPDIIGSIVTFNPKWELLSKTIDTFLASAQDAKIVVWDNSPSDKISRRLSEVYASKVTYLKSPGNYGYGKGHNSAFRSIHSDFQYLAILNPDVEIPRESIPELVSYLNTHPEYGLVTGSISGLDGKPHAVHKPFLSLSAYIRILLGRKFQFLKQDAQIENPFFPLPTQPVRVPVVSGCFMFFTKKHFEELGGFDERFFLYFEDYDLSLRSFMTGKSIVIPSIKIYHNWARESHKRFQLMLVHLRSAFTFYSKWGVFNRLPKSINRTAIESLQKKN